MKQTRRLELRIDRKTQERLDEVRGDESRSAWLRRKIDDSWRTKRNVIVECLPNGTVRTTMVPEDERV